jgi:hypothetical protein
MGRTGSIIYVVSLGVSGAARTVSETAATIIQMTFIDELPPRKFPSHFRGQTNLREKTSNLGVVSIGNGKTAADVTGTPQQKHSARPALGAEGRNQPTTCQDTDWLAR